eukprot:gene1001-1086_t
MEPGDTRKEIGTRHEEGEEEMGVESALDELTQSFSGGLRFNVQSVEREATAAAAEEEERISERETVGQPLLQSQPQSLSAQHATHEDTQQSSVAHPVKRSYSDNLWKGVSPLPKKIDMDETPIFDRGIPVSPIPGPPPPSFTSPLSPILDDDSPIKNNNNNNNIESFELHRTRGNDRVLVIGSVSAEHDTGAHHQENSQRTCLLCGEQGCLRRAELTGALTWMDADQLPPPPLADLLRVHEYEYLNYLEKRARSSSISANNEQTTPSSSSSSSSSSTGFPPCYAPQGMLDIDTPLVAKSLSAAKKFCAAVMEAVDAIMGKQEGYDRVFVIGRPPGHHAGPSGCVVAPNYWHRPGLASSGFCLLNNVAVAAAYARYRYGRDHPDKSLKIAIVDIDVHHGNGTEEIVRNLKPREVFLPLPSSWAPISRPSYKPWLNENDDREVFFASIQKFDGDHFYPGSGNERDNKVEENIVNISLTPLPPRDNKKKGRKLEDLMKAASDEFRSKVSCSLLPRLRDFKPDLTFISAGFDTHYDDMYHYLSEDDIHWITKQLCEINDSVGGQGVISVLEGGYSLKTDLPPELAPQPTFSSSGVASNGMSLRGKAAAKSAQQGVSVPSSSVTTGSSSQATGNVNKSRFAIRPGDGGLVKGVLAHVAALSRKDNW